MQERPNSYDRHPWYKVYSRESLEGSLRFDLDSEERGVWWDFCHMANESRNRGQIQANNETPYPHTWLAAKLNISLELLERCIKKFSEQKRISENAHGILVINFEYWQGLDTRRGRGRPPKPTRDTRSFEGQKHGHMVHTEPPTLEQTKQDLKLPQKEFVNMTVFRRMAVKSYLRDHPKAAKKWLAEHPDERIWG